MLKLSLLPYNVCPMVKKFLLAEQGKKVLFHFKKECLSSIYISCLQFFVANSLSWDELNQVAYSEEP